MIMIFMMVFLSEIFRGYVLNAVFHQNWDLQPLTLAVSSMLLWPFYHWIARRFVGALPETDRGLRTPLVTGVAVSRRSDLLAQIGPYLRHRTR